MRHFGSMLVAAVFGPAVFLLTGAGLSAFGLALDDDKRYNPLSSLGALGALLLAGGLYAILVMARLSPLGPGVAGIAAWGMTGWALFDIQGYRNLFAHVDINMGGAVGETGIGILLGLPLVATLFSGRWRGGEPAASPEPMIGSVTRHGADSAWLLPAAPVHPSTPLPEAPLPETPPPLRYPATSAFPSSRPVSTPPEQAPDTGFQPRTAAPSAWRTPPYVPPFSQPDSPPAPDPLTDPLPGFAPVTRGSAAVPEPPPSPIAGAPPGQGSALPRRIPSPAPAGDERTHPMASTSPPADNEVTENLGPPGSVVPQFRRHKHEH